MTSVWMFIAGLILMLWIGVYVVQALLWVALGAVQVTWLAVQALLVAGVAIIRPAMVAEAWRRSQAG